MSPLRWFRRHATWMLIIFGVILMAIFGLGPVFDQMTRGFQNSGPIDDPVIMKYRGGEITRTALDGLQRNHYATRRFLMELAKQSAKQCEANEVQYRPLAQMIQPFGRSDNQDILDEQTLVRKLLSDRAEDEGVVISDGMIDDYLALMAGNADFSPRDWKQINKLVNNNIPLSSIRNHLAVELKSMQMQRYASVGIPLNPTPTEAVELYARANDRIECEFVPVPVDEYLSQVTGEPSAAEMQALFEEGKYEYVDAGMQKPGFKVPRKVNVQYFTAEMETFLQNEKNKITDAEVEAEYEKLVAAEDPIVVEVIPQPEPAGFSLDLGDDDGKTATSATGTPTTGTPTTGTPTTGTPTIPATEIEKTEQPKVEKTDAVPGLDVKADVPVLNMPAAKTVEPSLPNPKTLINETPIEAKPGGLKVTPPAQGKGGQSLTVRKTKHQFASFVQEEEATAAVEAVLGNTTPMAPQVEVESTQAETTQDVGGLGGLQLSDESAGPMTGETNKKTRIKPLSEVEDEIRTRLARAKAFKKKDDASKQAEVSLKTHQMQVLTWENSQDRDTTPKPTPPDFEAIAKENGLLFGETGIVGRLELEKTAIGKVNYPVQVQSPDGGMRMDFQSVSNKVFLDYDRVKLLVPQTVSDLITGNTYVIWMSEKEDVRIPELADVKEQIIKYWKYQKAVELAREAAEKMAAQASADKKLTALFPEKAAPTGEFTWFRPGRGAQATFGNPIGVTNPGEEVMQTAFSLDEGGTGVAANRTRDIIYVLQRATPGTPVADLGQEYLDQQYFRFKRVPTGVMGAAQHYAQELEFDWRDEFVDSMELKRMK